MKKIGKKLTALMLSAAIVFSLSVGAYAAPAGVTGSGSGFAISSDYSLYVKGGYELYGDGLREWDQQYLTVWMGGGKYAFANGSTADSKSAQVYLSCYSFSDGVPEGYYDATAAKNTLWVSSASPITETDIKNGKYSQTADDKAGPKVSKGKVIAGKSPGDYYVSAFFLEDSYDDKGKLVKNGKATLVARVPVRVKYTTQLQAVLTAEDFTASGSLDNLLNGYGDLTLRQASANSKSITLRAGRYEDFYVYGYTKERYEADFVEKYGDVASQYVVSVTKGAEYITIDEPLIGIKDWDWGTFRVTAKENTTGKEQKATIVITNPRNGKKSSITVTVTV